MPSKRVKVEVQRDHIEAITRSKSPILAIAELIWNALDAESDIVEIKLVQNALGGLDEIQIVDFGTGLDHKFAEQNFKRIGGSWKRSEKKTHTKDRKLHGRQGQGRLKAFSIGDKTSWEFTYRNDKNQFLQYVVRGSKDCIEEFEITDPVEVDVKHTGTKVSIYNIQSSFPSLDPDKAIPKLTESFALFLIQYPDIKIHYDGVPIDPTSIQQEKIDLVIEDIEFDDGEKISAELTIIEWKSEQERAIVLCDEDGFPFREIKPAIHAKGFDFTAYIKCAKFRELNNDGRLLIDELDSDVGLIIEPAREKLKEHFKAKETSRSRELVDEWKQRDIYPYKAEPIDVLEQSKRQVFEICAVNLHNSLPDFERSSDKNKRLTLHLLKEALEDNPTALQNIFQSVLELPEEKQEELSELLKKTTLSAIIHASKEVAERLEFLQGLQTLLFDPLTKKTFKERSQLQRILVHNTWLFGETYNLMVDDQSLNNVLLAHINKLGRNDLIGEIEADVEIEGKKRGIVDLMLGQAARRGEGLEHLVVELKRPSVKVGMDEITQIKQYAFAIMKDKRFDQKKTIWKFFVVSNDISEDAAMESSSDNLPEGCVWAKDGNQIWVKEWGEIINECRGRIQFFQEKLEYEATNASGIEFLRKTYGKLIPES